MVPKQKAALLSPLNLSNANKTPLLRDMCAHMGATGSDGNTSEQLTRDTLPCSVP